MCTITLTYNQDDVKARQLLAALLASGLFVQQEPVAASEEQKLTGIDESDPWLFEEHGDMPSLPKGKEDYTPEEALDMILNDIRNIYKMKDAV